MVIKMVVNSSDITSKWDDIRTKLGYTKLYEILLKEVKYE